MIESDKQCGEYVFGIEKIDDKASFRIDDSFQPELHPVGMPMHPMAPMGHRDIR